MIRVQHELVSLSELPGSVCACPRLRGDVTVRGTGVDAPSPDVPRAPLQPLRIGHVSRDRSGRTAVGRQRLGRCDGELRWNSV